MKWGKPWLYLIGAAVLVLMIKYSDAIIQGGSSLISIITPMLVGCAIAYVLNILVDKVESLPPFRNETSPLYKGRRAISILASLAVLILTVVLLVLIIIPQLVDAFRVVLAGIPPLLEQIAKWAVEQDIALPEIQTWLNGVNWSQMAEKIIRSFTMGIGSLFSSTVTILSGLGSVLVRTVVGFIFALYLLAGKEKLGGQIRIMARTYLKEETCRKLAYLFHTANDVFTRFIVGQCTEAVIIGALCTLGMILFQFPYATMVGVLIGATALLPIVGAYLGAGIGAFMIFTVNPLQAVAFLIFIVVLQQLEGNLIYPRVVGSSIGLPGIWVLAAVTVGGGLGGIVGMLLAVPATATAYKLIRQDVIRRKSGQQPEN